MLDSIADIYSALAKAIECVSMALGPAILMGLVSSLLHLVATAYFLLVELVTKGFVPFTLVQFAWIGIHTTRMVLLVEPAHRAYYETQLTSDIIADSIRRPASPEIRDKVRRIQSFETPVWLFLYLSVGFGQRAKSFEISYLSMNLVGNVLAPTFGSANLFQRLRNVQNR